MSEVEIGTRYLVHSCPVTVYCPDSESAKLAGSIVQRLAETPGLEGETCSAVAEALTRRLREAGLACHAIASHDADRDRVVSFKVDGRTFYEIEEARRRLGISRSELIREAVMYYLRLIREEGVERALHRIREGTHGANGAAKADGVAV